MLHRLGLAAHAVVPFLFAVLGLFACPVEAQVPPPVAAATGVSQAAPEDPYTVSGVDVDITAASASEARDKAILEAQRKAFAVLFKRLAADGETRVAPSVGDSDLQRMVQGFEIERERGSAVRYVGALSFKFRRRAVRSYMSSLGVRVVEPSQRAAAPTGTEAVATPARTTPPVATPPTPGPEAPGVPVTVVLPVTQGAGVNLLWEERTPWRSAWEDFAAVAGAAKIVIPPGELTDVADIGANEALNGDGASLARIAAHYNAGDVVVAVLPAGATGAAGGAISINRYGANGQPDAAAAASVALAPVANEKPGVFLGRAVALVVDRLASLPNGGAPAVAAPVPAPVATETQLAVGVPISGMQDWLEIRRRLSSNPMVVGVDTASLSRTQIDIVIRFRGEQEGLRAMLDRDSLTLAPTPSGWTLHLKSSAQSGGVRAMPSVAPGPQTLGPSSALREPSAMPQPQAQPQPQPERELPAARPSAAPSEYNAAPDASDASDAADGNDPMPMPYPGVGSRDAGAGYVPGRPRP